MTPTDDLNDLLSVDMQPCSWRAVSIVLLNHHYLRRMPAGIMQCYAMVSKRNFMHVVGAAVFTNGGIQYDGLFLTFARLWVDDCMPCNTESAFMGYCLRDLGKRYPTYRGVVTWADPAQGHTGAIYRASNFAYDGQSRQTKRYKHASTGQTVYQRTVTGTSGYIEHKADEPKHRYIYYFNKRERETMRRNAINTAGA